MGTDVKCPLTFPLPFSKTAHQAGRSHQYRLQLKARRAAGESVDEDHPYLRQVELVYDHHDVVDRLQPVLPS
jgi:hypothetical protein